MTLRTPVCDLLGIDVPVGSAGMGGGTAGPALAAAVSNAGGLGCLGGVSRRGPDGLRDDIRRTRELTSRPFSVNLWVHFLDRFPLLLDVCIEERVPSVTLSFGAPGEHARRAKDAGLLVLHQVQTLAGAKDALAGGAVDVLIAQGGEAGGHTGSVATMALVPAVVDVAGATPVLAAGGIADGRGLAAALALGAQGAVLGTRFVAAAEATPPAHAHQQRIIDATPDDTVFTDVFDIVDAIPWPPGISGRSVRTPFSDEWHGREDELRRRRDAILAESPVPDEAPERAHSAYAGQSAGLIRDVRPAAAIIAEIVAEAEAVIAGLAR